ncbi:MAG: fatty acid desaturase [Verrucomicrobia bacterium]|nr:fatty acid desaturase [Verrucomicrobiota bacterium]
MPKLRIPWKSIRWSNTIFLLSTLIVALTAVPAYLWHEGLPRIQIIMFFVLFIATGMSITLGYHRLFSHRAFQASWPVRFLTLVFGAAAFENSALAWAADHRRHHKFVDNEEDPYDATKGLFHSHIGWILFKSQEDSSLDLVRDLQKDRLVAWQNDYYLPISITVGFALPAIIGGIWGGWSGALGGFLIPGVARLVLVQHFTFCINSLCHSIGRQPYSSACTARDSAIMAFVTFGEGYHNFHHTFQHDYRNGLKPWQFDPTKWTIWILHKLGLACSLRRVPQERVLLAEIKEQQRCLAKELQTYPNRLSEPIRSRLHAAQLRIHEAFGQWELREAEYCRVLERKIEASREKLIELRQELRNSRDRFRIAIHDWRESYRLALDHFAAHAAA